MAFRIFKKVLCKKDVRKLFLKAREFKFRTREVDKGLLKIERNLKGTR